MGIGLTAQATFVDTDLWHAGNSNEELATNAEHKHTTGAECHFRVGDTDQGLQGSTGAARKGVPNGCGLILLSYFVREMEQEPQKKMQVMSTRASTSI